MTFRQWWRQVGLKYKQYTNFFQQNTVIFHWIKWLQNEYDTYFIVHTRILVDVKNVMVTNTKHWRDRASVKPWWDSDILPTFWKYYKPISSLQTHRLISSLYQVIINSLQSKIDSILTIYDIHIVVVHENVINIYS